MQNTPYSWRTGITHFFFFFALSSSTFQRIIKMPLKSILWITIKAPFKIQHVHNGMDFSFYRCGLGTIQYFYFSMRSSQPRDQTQVSCIAGGFFTSWATRKNQLFWKSERIFIFLLSCIQLMLGNFRMLC